MLDARDWGAQLRFSAPPRIVERFYREFNSQCQSGSDLAPFTLYGSGDFHYLSALWLRRLTQPVVLVSFDNHPDWDVRPPKWGCGGWINRALDLAHVQHIAIWGCGNFECWWPHNIFANRSGEREGRLEVHPWADDRPMKDRQRRGAILQDNWRDHFEMFVANLGGANVYVTIDLDCLDAKDVVTNWESGRFTIADLEWSLGELRQESRIIGGDICGGYSEPNYARWKQRFASEWDHPKLDLPAADQIRKINFAALERLWPALAH
ncbi:MAG TPA: hypothetical protein VEP30_04015 [Chthoniobacterales bacterium]|nr:hypothetical protein [Chthoniobacterales bacterium]